MCVKLPVLKMRPGVVSQGLTRQAGRRRTVGKWYAFISLITLLVRLLRAVCRSKHELILENLALRQQVGSLKLRTLRPKLHDADRAFWVALRKIWSRWTRRLVIAKPETVVHWQRRRFRRY